jgi:hypothetical protein
VNDRQVEVLDPKEDYSSGRTCEKTPSSVTPDKASAGIRRNRSCVLDGGNLARHSD